VGLEGFTYDELAESIERIGQCGVLATLDAQRADALLRPPRRPPAHLSRSSRTPQL